MKVKIDTKEKFHVITLISADSPASMTEELNNCLLPFLQSDVKNLVLNLKGLQLLDTSAAENLVKVQQKFYEQNSSFVICELQQPVEEFLEQHGLIEVMNFTPTESEAADIVQMEEIERELMGGGDDSQS